MGLKNKIFEFPNVKQSTPLFDDILAEYEESTMPSSGGPGRRVWRHAANVPDDFLHALVNAWLAAKVATGTVSLYENDSMPAPQQFSPMYWC